MVEQLPRNDVELAHVSGVGAKKLERYGKEFMAPIAESLAG